MAVRMMMRPSLILTPSVDPSPLNIAESVVTNPLTLYPEPNSSALSDRSNKIPPAESKDISLAKEPEVIFAADKLGILAVLKVPDVTLPAPIDMTGTRAESNTPDVILDVARLGISFASKLILALSIVPDVILLASI